MLVNQKKSYCFCLHEQNHPHWNTTDYQMITPETVTYNWAPSSEKCVFESLRPGNIQTSLLIYRD